MIEAFDKSPLHICRIYVRLRHVLTEANRSIGKANWYIDFNELIEANMPIGFVD